MLRWSVLIPVFCVCQCQKYSTMYELSSQEIQSIVDTHNYYRDLVANKKTFGQPGGIIPHVHWDEGLAEFSYNYLKNNIKNNSGFCRGGHNPDRCYFHDSTVDTVGENIAYSSHMDVPSMIGMWFDEHKYYVYNNESATTAILKQHPDIVIGHYTQLVWARSTKVGCAVAAHCTRFGENYEYMLLCNYNPTGNTGDGTELPYYRVRKPKAWAKYNRTDYCNTCQKNNGMWSSCISGSESDKDEEKILERYLLGKATQLVYFYSMVYVLNIDNIKETNLWVVICNALINQAEEQLSQYRLLKYKTQCVQQTSWKNEKSHPMEKLSNPDNIALAVCKPVWQYHMKHPDGFSTSWNQFCDQFPKLKDLR